MHLLIPMIQPNYSMKTSETAFALNEADLEAIVNNK